MINRLKKTNIIFLIIDIIIIAICYVAAFFILDYQELYKTAIAKNIILSICVYEVFLNFFKMYLNMVNYEEGTDYLKYIFCSFLSMGVLTFFGKFLNLSQITINPSILPLTIFSLSKPKIPMIAFL